jgi:GNAT superfamily N-acetyltransferase
MAADAENGGGRSGSRWRIAAWGTAAALMLLPLVAMQVTDEVVWDLADFAFAGALVGGVGVTYELAVRMTRNRAYRAAVAVALAAAFILVWVNAAVGIIGSEDNPANLMYGGVLAVGIVGAVIARFQPHGMARALVATALAQVSVAAIALIAGLGSTASGPLEILTLNGCFAALWLMSAWLFRKAAREPNSRRPSAVGSTRNVRFPPRPEVGPS